MILRTTALRVRIRTPFQSYLASHNNLVARQLCAVPQDRFQHTQTEGKYTDEESNLRHDEDVRCERSPRITKVMVGPSDVEQKIEPLVPYQLRKAYPRRALIRKVSEGLVNVEKLEGQHTGVSDKPPGIIVLRGDHAATYDDDIKYMEPVQNESIDILAAVNAERGLVSHAQVMQNIEGLRPRYKRALSWKEFQEIEAQLHDGFTMMQLTSYIQNKKLSSSTVSDHVEKNAGRTKKMTLSRWVPGVSDSMLYFDGSMMRGYVAEDSFTRKQMLVIALMRECWDVEVKDLVDAPGELEINLKDDVLKLLLSGATPPLKNISDRYLRASDSKIVVSRSRNVIRVTARKDEAVEIAEAVAHLVNRTKQIDIDAIYTESKQLSTPEAVLELESLTGTMIKIDPYKSGVKVFGLEDISEKRHATWLENVQRLLMAASKHATMQTRRLACLDVPRLGSAILQNNTLNLPWHLRARKWTRWASETNKSGECLEDEVDMPYQPFEEFTKVAEAKSLELEENEIWVSESNTTTSAIVGHVLHEGKTEDTLSDLTLTSSVNTEFLPMTQSLSQLLQDEMDDEVKSPTTRVKMRFIPKCYNRHDFKNFELYPEINIYLAVTNIDEQLIPQSVIAITNNIVTDVMVPDRSLDIRYEQKVTWHAKRPDRLRALKEFLNDSQLNLSTRTILAPSSLRMPIPKQLYSATSKEPGNVPIEYMFAGLEFHETFETRFGAGRLFYTHVDGGATHGNRIELALQPQKLSSSPNLSPDASLVLQQEKTQDFVEATFNLLDELESPERDEPVRRQIPPSIFIPRVSKSQRASVSGKDSRSLRLFTRPIDFGIQYSKLETEDVIRTKGQKKVRGARKER